MSDRLREIVERVLKHDCTAVDPLEPSWTSAAVGRVCLAVARAVAEDAARAIKPSRSGGTGEFWGGYRAAEEDNWNHLRARYGLDEEDR